MPIDPRNEVLYPLKHALCFAPRSNRTGRHLHVSVLYRWARKGVVRNGIRVRLDAIQCASGLATSREAMARFLTELNDAEETTNSHIPRPQSRSTRSCEQNSAARELDRAGI